MSTLTYSNPGLMPEAGRADTAPRKGFWRRAFERLVAAQQRRADREIAAFLARHGGVLSDDMEREIMQRMNGRRSV